MLGSWARGISHLVVICGCTQEERQVVRYSVYWTNGASGLVVANYAQEEQICMDFQELIATTKKDFYQ